MRSSEVLGRRVLTPGGTEVGRVHDLRLSLEGGGELRVTGVLVGPRGWRCTAAFAWGIAQNRTAGPALLRRMVLGRAARFTLVPVSKVIAWDRDGKFVVAEHALAGDR